MPTSYQEPAAGSKSAKFVTANPLDPMIRPFENQNAHEDDPQRILADNINERLTKSMTDLQMKHAAGTNEVDDPDRAPTGTGYQMQGMSQQHMQRMSQQQHMKQQVVHKVTPPNHGKKDDGKDDDDEDYDWLLDEDVNDEDPVLEALRERRLAELKRGVDKKVADLARGHGEVRTISQDEFLPECTGTSEWVAVHFYHNEFNRCKVMDHHLKIVAVKHTECKILRIDAEKAPFFVHKLQIKTLPTVLVLQNGNVVDRLVGFEGLQTDSPAIQHYQQRQFADKEESDPDQWQTKELQKWLAKSGAVTFHDVAKEEEPEIWRQRVRGCLSRGGVRNYEDDN